MEWESRALRGAAVRERGFILKSCDWGFERVRKWREEEMAADEHLGVRPPDVRPTATLAWLTIVRVERAIERVEAFPVLTPPFWWGR